MGNCILTKGNNFYGIDTSNVIANKPKLPYTATQDCFCVVTMYGNSSQGLSIDGVTVAYAGLGLNTNPQITQLISIKTGQVINKVENAPYGYTFYGIK